MHWLAGMKVPAPALIRLVVAVSLLGGSIASHAAMYKWTDEDGSVTYSNTPPVDRAKVKEFTKVDDLSTVPADKRPKEAHGGNEKRGAENATAKSDTPAAQAEASSSSSASAAPRPLILVNPDPSKADAKPAQPATRPESVRREAEVVRPDGAPRAATVAPTLQPEAVQDPCLRSADPHCYQRNRDKYHPYLGYAPSATRAPGAPVVGASVSPAAGGSVGAQVGSSPASDKRAAPSVAPAPAIRVQTK